MKIQPLILMMMCMAASTCFGQEPSEAPAPLLAELVAEADLVALVRVLDTDYEYAREFPVGGTAFLQVLVPYKVGRPLEDIIEVYDEGLREGECYFDNPTVLEEGRRHLVFLRFSPEVEDQYNGLGTGCRLDVLVNEQNQYALRYPLNGITLADDVSELAQAMTFQDSYALVADEEISPDERNGLLSTGHLETVNGQYRFTHGIEISRFRKLMGPEALTLDRAARQYPRKY